MQTLIFRSDSEEKLDALKAVARALKISFETEEKPYNPEFVAKIKQSQEDLKAGKGRSVDMKELNKNHLILNMRWFPQLKRTG